MYLVNEIFDSIQGEGFYAGLPATFIRLQGCPIGCEWCDTPLSWNMEGSLVPVKDVRDQIGHDLVVITGGEPLIHNLDPLLDEICHHQLIQVETSGFVPWKGDLRPDFITCSPKAKVDFQVNIDHVDEMKFVVDEDLTFNIIPGVMLFFPDALATFMPEGCPPTLQMRQKAMEFTLKAAQVGRARYSDRLQYLLEVK